MTRHKIFDFSMEDKLTPNEIVLLKLKERYPNLNIEKPEYPNDYWDELDKIIKDNE